MTNNNNSFSFGIITDTHMRSPEGDLSTVFPVNERANGRARYAVSLLQQEDHDFVIHLGDVVHPLPHMDSYHPAAKEAHKILTPLKPKLHFVPGNHDLGDKLSEVAPAKAANESTVSIYREAFGDSYYSFEHKDILFVVVNSSLVNGGTNEENKQRYWLEELLKNQTGKRIFLFSHYPPFICDENESEHYDNYAEPGRHWLLDLAFSRNVEAIISGHVHHFFINKYKGIKLYCLPSTSFTRQDFSSIFRGLPADEFGRDDKGKFGVTIFHVNESGHDFTWIPTHGREVGADQETSYAETKVLLQMPRLIPSLRHDWCQPVIMPANGPMEEFSRKITRNDYPLLRLKQLGIQTVRVPLVDFLNPGSAKRISVLGDLGIKSVVFFSGRIEKTAVTQLIAASKHIHAIELISREISDELLVNLENIDIPIWFSKISTSANQKADSKPFNISVSTGCMLDEMKNLASTMSTYNAARYSKLVVQCPWQGNAMGYAIKNIIDEWAKIQNKEIDLAINIRLASTNPSEENVDSKAISAAIQSIQFLAKSSPTVEFILDTFEAFDRGYHPRLGLIDTLSNISDWYPTQR